ncbi:unnamed protein product [Cylindrotheca closterium]|uniref:Uncharacterized protein n=1 Tax=Cylindrotheca closterium TaxID=2856 RepID=A0AAD2FIJ2_9STRA|nr:unnamed protein product [Cylindrotheca closterium]
MKFNHSIADSISENKFLQSWIGKLILGGIALVATLRYSAGIYAWRQTELLERPKYQVLQQLSNGVELRRYEPYIIAETTIAGQSGFKQPSSQGFRVCAGYIFGKNRGMRQPKTATSWFRGEKSLEAEKMAMTAPVRVEGTVENKSTSEGEKMAMTAPVRVQGSTKYESSESSNPGKNGSTKVSFVIGSKYSLKTVPRPLDSKSIKLREVPAHTLAVRQFNGPPPSEERVRKERHIIDRALAKADVAMDENNVKQLTLKQKKKNGKGDDDTTLVYGYHDPFITPNFLRRNEVAVVVEGTV